MTDGISDREREDRLAIVRRVAVAIANGGDKELLSKIQILTARTLNGQPCPAEELDRRKPVAVHEDGGRYFIHVRTDGRGQINVHWPNGVEKTVKFEIPAELLPRVRDEAGGDDRPWDAEPVSVKVGRVDDTSEKGTLSLMISLGMPEPEARRLLAENPNLRGIPAARQAFEDFRTSKAGHGYFLKLEALQRLGFPPLEAGILAWHDPAELSMAYLRKAMELARKAGYQPPEPPTLGERLGMLWQRLVLFIAGSR